MARRERDLLEQLQAEVRRLESSLSELRAEILEATADAADEENRTEDVRRSLLGVFVPNDELLAEIDQLNQGARAGLSLLFFGLRAGVAGFTWAAALWGRELFHEHRWLFNPGLLCLVGIAVVAAPWLVKELWGAVARRHAKGRRRTLIGASGSRQRAPAPVPPLAEGEVRIDILERHIAELGAAIERHESFLEGERSRASEAEIERARLEALIKEETEAQPRLLLERDLAKAAHDERLEK